MNAAAWWLMVVGCVLPGVVVAWAAGFAVRRFGPRWGLVDRPGQRKIHARPMPTSGGLAIWLGLVLPLASGQLLLAILPAAAYPEFVRPHISGLWLRSGQLWTLLGCGSVLMLLGLWDDRRGLAWQFRLGVQTLVAVAMVLLGWRMTVFVDQPWLTGALSVLWIVGLVNSFNMLDNMDGLSAGVAAIAAAVLAGVMLIVPHPLTQQPQLFVGGLLLLLVGVLLGFLWHNHSPARLFMGDAGSYLIGFLLATITLTGTFAGYQAHRHAVLAPLCALAVPLYDSASVVLIRLSQGRSPFVGDKSHFSHRLVSLGLTPRQAVLTIYLASATCGLSAFLLHQVNAFGAVLVMCVVGLTLALVAILEAAGQRARRRSEQLPPDPSP